MLGPTSSLQRRLEAFAPTTFEYSGLTLIETAMQFYKVVFAVLTLPSNVYSASLPILS